jgi:hypothetical protein
MGTEKKSGWFWMPAVMVILLMIACSLSPGSSTIPEQTPTPTPTAILGNVEPTPIPSRCAGLSGAFELQLLVGPADAVGLEPHAIGEIPFSVEGSGDPYLLTGATTIIYEDVLQEEWGTYTVNFNMDVSLSGECSGEVGNEVLNVHVLMSGDQVVEVEADGFHGEYPWAGTHENDLSFPLQEGASADGEGWALVLHLIN